jgi:hypothetical protein
MRVPDPSLTEQLLENGVVRDSVELREVLQEAAWLAHQAEITAALPLDDEEPSVPPALEVTL